MIDKSQWPFNDKDLALQDIGHGVFVSRVMDREGSWVGIIEWHECPESVNVTESGLAAGSVNFDNSPPWVTGPRWQKVQDDPLTISPSVLCSTCGLHGFIQNGQWVPA